MNKESTLSVMSGYEKLKKAVEDDCENRGGIWKADSYLTKFEWVLKRADYYADKTGLTRDDFLNAWEKTRYHWYMNYYSEENQPLINEKLIKVFRTKQEMEHSIGTAGFRCHSCNGISASPYVCDDSNNTSKGACGLNYTYNNQSGCGAYVFVAETMVGERILVPINWEV